MTHLTMAFVLLWMVVTGPQTFTVPILAYHSVCAQEKSENCVSVEQFRAQIEYLQQSGYETITFQDLLRLETGLSLLPKKPVLLTFDDGYRDNYTTMLPILREKGMRATVFLISRKVGDEGYLTWEQVLDMSRLGFDFGAHTLTHPDVTKLAPEQQREEISLSKQEIEQHLGRPVIAFAYPYGQYDAAAEQVVRESGYRYAVSGDEGRAAVFEEPLRLKRIVMSGYVTLQQFSKNLP